MAATERQTSGFLTKFRCLELSDSGQSKTTQDLSYKLYWSELEDDSDLVAKWDQEEVDRRQEWKRVVTSVEEQPRVAK